MALKAACNIGIFSGLKTPNGGPSISHLLYADDALLIREWSKSNIKSLAKILGCFHVSLRLKVNFHRPKVFGVRASVNEINN